MATWYCLPGISRCTVNHPADELVAAVRKDLLLLKGSSVTVCLRYTPGRCIRVKVSDCNCGSQANLVDLYASAFVKLAPLASGRIDVILYP